MTVTQKAEAEGCTFEASLEYLVRYVSKNERKYILFRRHSKMRRATKISEYMWQIQILNDDQNINDKGKQWRFHSFEDIEILSYIKRQCHSFLFKTRQKSTANTTNWKAVVTRDGEDEEWGSPGL